jgi:hypothetical protein
MNKTWRNVGLIALGAGLLTYPAILLFRYVSNRLQNDLEDVEGSTKEFAPSYRKQSKPHRRKVGADNQLQEG